MKCLFVKTYFNKYEESIFYIAYDLNFGMDIFNVLCNQFQIVINSALKSIKIFIALPVAVRLRGY